MKTEENTFPRNQIIASFAERMKVIWAQDEDNVYRFDNYKLYCPGSNSLIAEELTEFEVWRGVVIPGRMYMPNGDPGYPDDYDEQEVSRHPNLLSALEKIGHCMVTDWINDEAMAEAMDSEIAYGEAAEARWNTEGVDP